MSVVRSKVSGHGDSETDAAVSVVLYDMVFYVCVLVFFFFFNDTATTEIYTLSLHDALPI